MTSGVGARRGVRILYLIAAGAWLLLADLVLLTALGGRLPQPMGVAGSWVFVAVSAGLLAAIGGREVAGHREQTRLLRQHQDALAALGAVTEPSLAALPVNQLLDEMLERLQTVLGVETSTIYLVGDDPTRLMPRAARGFDTTVSEPLRIDEGFAGRMVAARQPLISDSRTELETLTPPLEGLTSVAGCPIVVEGRLVGVCIVGSTTPTVFNEADIQLLQLVADRVGAGVERSRLDEAERGSRQEAEQARRHVTMLGLASEALSTAIDDYEPHLASLVDVVVPDFADWCAVDLVERDGSLRRLAVRHWTDRSERCSDELKERFPNWDYLSAEARQVGRSQLARSPTSEGGSSCIVTPIRVRDQPVGVITFVIDPGRRAYQSPDVAAADDVAGRAAVTIERVTLYREVKTREARWRALVEATPAGIVEVDLDGRILLWNRFAGAMFGWDGDGPSPAAPPAFAPEVAERLSDLWARAADGEEIFDDQLSVTAGKGQLRDLAVSVAPQRAADGTVLAILTLATDVTERRRFQERLREAQRMEALGQIAGGVAHDFNNLLTVITGYADLLMRRLTLDASDRELFDNIRTAADRASVLTGQLLAISRRQVAKPVTLAPHVALQSLAEVLQRILGIDIVLRWDLDTTAGNLSIDPSHFEQVILNLAINARDAMPDGGMLTIATVGVGLDVLEGAALGLLPGHYVRITVSDNGLGMDAETLERCLEPFFTTKDRSKGTGLGLAAVQGIVTDGGGQIQVDSQAAVGTTFTLHLPVAVGELIAQIPLPPRPDIRGSETVLVVDDEADIRQLIRKVLLHDGYLVLDAGGGLEAVRVAERWEGPIELLITDVVMPGMRGPEVATAIRAIRPSIEVLFMSGYTHGTTLPAGLSTDPLALLAKPFKPSELADRVRGILDQHYDRARARNGSPRPAPS